MDYVLTTNALSKEYGTFKSLNAASMHVPKGAIYGFVGKMALSVQEHDESLENCYVSLLGGNKHE